MVDESASLLKPEDYEWTWADFDDWSVAKYGFKTGLPKNRKISLSESQKTVVKKMCNILKNMSFLAKE